MRLSYAWRVDGLFDADANDVGNRLSELEAEHGSLTKDVILQEAQKKMSPLYPLIERDPGKALEILAHKTVGSIVGNLLLVKNNKKTRQRAFVYVEPTKNQRKAFVSLVVALRTPTLREQVVDRAIKDLDRWFDRYGSLREFRPIQADLRQVRDRIQEELLEAV